MGTLTQGQISKKNFEVGPEVVQPGPELVQPGPEVVQVGPLLVHSNISSTGKVWFGMVWSGWRQHPSEATVKISCDHGNLIF